MPTGPENIYWFLGLSGSGKTTLSRGVADQLRARGLKCLILDGDILRGGLCSDLDFSPEGRRENLRRAGELALIASGQNLICLCAFITPYQSTRNMLRQRLGSLLHEIYIKCPIDICIERDPKHNYSNAKKGLISGYTGVDAPYDPPTAPQLCVETDKLTIEASVQLITGYILQTLAEDTRE